jgi:predicted nuclease of predicted toxin-antitoxin system
MKFIVDAQLPFGLCRWLKVRGSEAHYGPDLFSGDEDDAVIARYAAEHQLIVVSKDRDLSISSRVTATEFCGCAAVTSLTPVSTSGSTRVGRSLRRNSTLASAL